MCILVSDFIRKIAHQSLVSLSFEAYFLLQLFFFLSLSCVILMPTQLPSCLAACAAFTLCFSHFIYAVAI
jgi:hypothetical protein